MEIPTVPCLYGVYNTDNHFILHQEYIEGDTLREFQKKNKLTEDQCFEITWRLVQTLYSVYNKGFIHRDIKPRNILIRKDKKNVENYGVSVPSRNLDICDNSVKQHTTNDKINFSSKGCPYEKVESDELKVYLIDFGFALTANDKKIREKLMFKICGTKGYIAPEVIIANSDKKRDRLDYSKVDVFSVGVILYEMLTGKNPFYEGTSKEIMKKNLKCVINFKNSKIRAMNPERRDFLTRLCCRDPRKR